jgi:hypothetical protein
MESQKELTARVNLSADGLFSTIRNVFLKIPEHRIEPTFSLVDSLMSAYAMFSLKSPSLLEFEREKALNKNLKSIYKIENIPSDTQMREIIDGVETIHFRRIFKILFSYLQRGKVLESYKVLGDYYVLSGDGTCFFSSETIHCEHCLTKTKSNGTIYQHMIYGACLVHPYKKEVFPFMPEFITNRDGSNKNDCELNSSKRFIEDFRREHPHLKVIFVEDSLFSNAPHIELLKNKNISFIIGAKESNHKYLYRQFDDLQKSGNTQQYHIEKEGYSHYFSFTNGLKLNNSSDTKINVLEYKQVDKKDHMIAFSWVTDIEITNENVYELMRIGRSRWKIENETFNTLKNQGYHFEHNFGHGKNNLSNNFAVLMMLAFLVDQIQLASCSLFKKALETFHAKRLFWQKIRNLFEIFEFESMELLFQAIAYGFKAKIVIGSNTS